MKPPLNLSAKPVRPASPWAHSDCDCPDCAPGLIGRLNRLPTIHRSLLLLGLGIATGTLAGALLDWGGLL